MKIQESISKHWGPCHIKVYLRNVLSFGMSLELETKPLGQFCSNFECGRRFYVTQSSKAQVLNFLVKIL